MLIEMTNLIKTYCVDHIFSVNIPYMLYKNCEKQEKNKKVFVKLVNNCKTVIGSYL